MDGEALMEGAYQEALRRGEVQIDPASGRPEFWFQARPDLPPWRCQRWPNGLITIDSESARTALAPQEDPAIWAARVALVLGHQRGQSGEVGQ